NGSRDMLNTSPVTAAHFARRNRSLRLASVSVRPPAVVCTCCQGAMFSSTSRLLFTPYLKVGLGPSRVFTVTPSAEDRVPLATSASIWKSPAGTVQGAFALLGRSVQRAGSAGVEAGDAVWARVGAVVTKVRAAAAELRRMEMERDMGRFRGCFQPFISRG